jgi:acyl-CoA thioesterase-2
VLVLTTVQPTTSPEPPAAPAPAPAPSSGSPPTEPCPFRARAWWGDRLVADSTAAVRLEDGAGGPLRCFPAADVTLDAADGEADAEADGGDGTGGDGSTRPLVRRFDARSPAAVRDTVAFDHDRVLVQLEDPMGGEDPRDVTVKRFPTWGDVDHLVEMLDVRPAGPGRYVGVARGDRRRPVVEGSQVLGQAIVAAGRHAPGRRAVSAHMVFARAADALRPFTLDLDEVSAGRTFTTLGVQASQAGRVFATGTLLLDVTAPDVIRHGIAPSDVAGPYGCEPVDMAMTGRDVRVEDGAYTGDPGAPIGPPTLDAWVRFREAPDDPYLHAGLLAQFTGHMSIAAALRPHHGVGQDQAHQTLSTAINAITLTLHRDVRADRWMHYRHLSTFAGDGMTHAECRVHDEAGDLVASFTVEAMVRGFGGGGRTVDSRTAL